MANNVISVESHTSPEVVFGQSLLDRALTTMAMMMMMVMMIMMKLLMVQIDVDGETINRIPSCEYSCKKGHIRPLKIL